jgi:hypothetical protein
MIRSFSTDKVDINNACLAPRGLIMPTDHQLSEHHPPHSERRAGMIITVLIVVALLGWAIWLMQ